MKKSYYCIIIDFCLVTFSSVINANYSHNKYISYFKNKLIRTASLALAPINVKNGAEQVGFIEVTKNGSLFRVDAKKPIINKIFYKNITSLLQLASPYNSFPNTFNKCIKLSKLKLTFIINNENKITVKDVKLIELKNVIPKNL